MRWAFPLTICVCGRVNVHNTQCPGTFSACSQEEPVRCCLNFRKPVGDDGGARLPGNVSDPRNRVCHASATQLASDATSGPCGSQAFAAALVAFAGLYLRHRFSINPRAVYRQAMVKLNTSPSVLEVRHSPAVAMCCCAS